MKVRPHNPHAVSSLEPLPPPESDQRLRRVFYGVSGAPAAFWFDAYGLLPAERQLRKLIVKGRWRGQQAGWESPDRQRRVFTKDRASLREMAASELAAGRRASANRAMHLHDSLNRHTESLANVFFDSRVRNCFGSHVLAAVEAVSSSTPVNFYTLLSPTSRIAARKIATFKPADSIEPLRQQLYRSGLKELSGWFILGLHGEHQSDGSVDVHPHVVVVGDKAQAFEALRELPQYQGGRDALVEEPVQRDPLRQPVRQINYLFQHAWSFKVDDDPASETYGTRGRRRVPPCVAHGRYLVWRARQRFSDLTWMHGIRLRGGRLQPSNNF